MIKKYLKNQILKRKIKSIYLLKILRVSDLVKKLDYIKIGLFKIINKVIEVLYRLDLLLKIKIYLIHYISILELVYGNHEPLVYKQDMYKGHKEDKQLIKKILQYNKVDS